METKRDVQDRQKDLGLGVQDLKLGGGWRDAPHSLFLNFYKLMRMPSLPHPAGPSVIAFPGDV